MRATELNILIKQCIIGLIERRIGRIIRINTACLFEGLHVFCNPIYTCIWHVYNPTLSGNPTLITCFSASELSYNNTLLGK
jgi:hypothetical protein